MRVLGISLFTTLACALFSGAIPIRFRRRDDVQVSARGNSEQIPEILTVATNKLTAVKTDVESIALTTVDSVIPVVKADLGKVHSILNDTITAVEAVAGPDIDVVLTDVAKLVVAVITLVAEILYTVVKLVGTVEHDIIAPLISDIGSLLAALLGLIFKLIPGLLSPVTSLLGDVTRILAQLNLDGVLHVLGIVA